MMHVILYILGSFVSVFILLVGSLMILGSYGHGKNLKEGGVHWNK
jgi:hypothetical protein